MVTGELLHCCESLKYLWVEIKVFYMRLFFSLVSNKSVSRSKFSSAAADLHFLKFYGDILPSGGVEWT